MGMIRTESSGGVYAIRISRPEVRNALNEVVIAELTLAVASPPADARLIVLSGEGPSFCAGADAEWMRRSKGFSREENQRDAGALASLLRAVDECPLPVVARIHGAALGGGAGLAAVCDIALAEEGTQFGFPEVRLGIVPAVISPYVLSRIGIAAARRYFLTGERFDARVAASIGLVHEAVPAGTLDERLKAVVSELLKGGPLAQRAAKKLIREAAEWSKSKAVEETVRLISDLRITPEAQEGLTAFLEKRKPNWS